MKLPPSVALGTMHGKALAIAPPLAPLGVQLVVAEGLDTDRFGTFAGDVPRAGNMLEAARAKAGAAARLTGLPVALASEGAYGPHPSVPFLSLGRELILWLDTRTGHEIVVHHIDETPDYDRFVASSYAEAEPLLARIGFPATAVILSAEGAPTRPLARGLRDRAALAAAFAHLPAGTGALIQSDMRAHMNPRRMAQIALLAQRLAERLAQVCPSCGAPGWGPLRPAPGLPCDWCEEPTLLPGGEVQGCTACGASQTLPRPDGLIRADPAYCPACNP